MVEFPTYLKDNVLDLKITNIPERVVDVTEERQLGRSDHVMILMRKATGVGSKGENTLNVYTGQNPRRHVVFIQI